MLSKRMNLRLTAAKPQVLKLSVFELLSSSTMWLDKKVNTKSEVFHFRNSHMSHLLKTAETKQWCYRQTHKHLRPDLYVSAHAGGTKM